MPFTSARHSVAISSIGTLLRSGSLVSLSLSLQMLFLLLLLLALPLPLPAAWPIMLSVLEGASIYEFIVRSPTTYTPPRSAPSLS